MLICGYEYYNHSCHLLWRPPQGTGTYICKLLSPLKGPVEQWANSAFSIRVSLRDVSHPYSQSGSRDSTFSEAKFTSHSLKERECPFISDSTVHFVSLDDNAHL
jgi:hypothetical protein